MIKDMIALAIAAIALWLLSSCASDPAPPIQAYREQAQLINVSHTQSFMLSRQPPPPYPHYFR